MHIEHGSETTNGAVSLPACRFGMAEKPFQQTTNQTTEKQKVKARHQTLIRISSKFKGGPEEKFYFEDLWGENW